MPAKRRGFVGNIYWNSEDNKAIPASFTRIVTAMDIKLTDAAKTFDASDRGSNFMKYLTAMLDVSLEFSIIFDITDVMHLRLQDSYRTFLPIDLWVADGASNEVGASGPEADWLITDFSKDMPLADGMKINIKAVMHGNCRFEPIYYTVS